MTTVMIVGAGRFQLPAIATAQRLGYEVIAVDSDPAAPGLPVASHSRVCDIKDADQCIEIARAFHISGVFTVAAEAAVRTVAAVAAKLGLPGISESAARAATDKRVMRDLCATFGVPAPRYAACRTIEEARRHAAAFGFPVVVKPPDSSGSRGVSLVKAPAELAAASNMALGYACEASFLVEEFMEGPELSVEAFVKDGELHVLALSDKIRTPPPALLDTTVLFPSELPAVTQAQAVEVARAAVRAAGIDNATIHMEQILTADGPKMVEMAARGAGFHVFTEILPWVTGVDVVEQLIRLSLGLETDFTVKGLRGAVLRFPEARTGRVTAVDGVERARNVSGIRDLEIYVKPGDVIRPLRSGSDRIGHIIAMADTRAHAAVAVATAERTIQVDVDDDVASAARVSN